MNPTGSISERSWRTRRGVRVLCGGAVALLALLVAARARAEWQPSPLTVNGKPTSVVDVWRPGVFSVGITNGPTDETKAGAYLFVDGGITISLVRGDAYQPAGVYYQPPPDDCLVLVQYVSPAGERHSAPADGGTCRNATADILTTTDVEVYQVKHARGGGAAAVGVSSSSSTPALYVSDGGIYGTAFSAASLADDSVAPDVAPGVVRVNSGLEVFVPAFDSKSSIQHYVAADAMTYKQTPMNGGLGYIQAIDAFPAGSPQNSYVVVGTNHGFLQGPGARPVDPDHTWLVQAQQALDGGLGVSSVAMNVEAGGEAGYGFGMAVVSLSDGGTPGIMSAVPVGLDTQAGTVWRPRVIPSGMASALLRYVACAGASYCVVTADRTYDNLFIYTNDWAPTFTPTLSPMGAGVVDAGVEDAGVANGLAQIDEGQTVTLSLTASDQDGDPLLVTSSATMADGGTPLPGVALLADGLSVTLTAPSVCRDQDLGALHIHASDGMQAHARHEHLELVARHTQVPALPLVQLADGGTVSPGGAAVPLAPGTPLFTLQPMSHTTAAGCELDENWVPLSGGTYPISFSQDAGTAQLSPPADFCEPGGQDFAYRLDVSDDGGLRTSGVFKVHLEYNQASFTSGALTLALDAGTPPGGVVSVRSNLNCPKNRSLSADLRLTRADGTGGTRSQTVAVPSDWPLPDDLGCGRYQLTGSMHEAGSAGSVESNVLEFPGQDAGLNPLPSQTMVARCGEGAHATLTASFPPDTCQTPLLTWQQQSGPPLVDSTITGNARPMATKDTGLDSLVGQSVVLTVSADSGSGPAVTTNYTLPITVDPFVKVSHRTEVPAASETDFVGIFSELKNTTSCGVTNVRYVEQLEGFTYVEGSARFNDQKVDATWDGTTLSVSGLELAGDSTGSLTYLARPHLVGTRHIQGEAFLVKQDQGQMPPVENAVPISLSETPEPPADSGCGCTSSAGSAPLLLALGALARATRRRRA